MTAAFLLAAALLGAAGQATPYPAAQAEPGTQQPPGGGGPRGPGGPMGGGAAMLRMADRDGDGVVTRDEYLAAADARFAREDRNGDGVITPDEMPRWGGRMRGPGGDTPPPPPPNGDSPAATGTPPAPPPPPPPGARGPITRAQYREMALRRFQRWDTNGDGRLDQAEIAAAGQRGPDRFRRGTDGDGSGRMPQSPGE